MAMDRDTLNHRINKRVDIMMDMGLLSEVETVSQYRQYTALNTVGYKEIFDYMDQKISLQQAVENIKTNTRRYAKRQMTWFRRYSDIKWINITEHTNILKQALEIIEG